MISKFQQTGIKSALVAVLLLVKVKLHNVRTPVIVLYIKIIIDIDIKSPAK